MSKYKPKGYFLVNIQQLIKSPVFYLSVIAVALLCLLSIWDMYREIAPADYEALGVVYFFDLFIGLTMFKKLVVMFAALPFVSSFCSDWNCQYIKPVVIRCGVKRYSASKAIVCFMSAFTVAFVGLCIFIFLLNTKMPMYPNQNIADVYGKPFGALINGKMPILYMIVRIIFFSLSSALWSLVAMAISSYLPNRFVAISTPVISSYVLEELTAFLPDYLYLYYLTRGANVLNQGALITFVYICTVFIFLSGGAACIFHRQVKRRIRNEVV